MPIAGTFRAGSTDKLLFSTTGQSQQSKILKIVGFAFGIFFS